MMEGNLLYKEDSKVKAFLSDSFNFVYDKETCTSMKWGKTKDENPAFNPIGPEKVFLYVGEDYAFDENQLKNLFSLNTDSVCTVCSYVILDTDDVITENIKLLYKWFLLNDVFVGLKLTCSKFNDLRSAMKLKLDELMNIILSVNENDNVDDIASIYLANGFKIIISIDAAKLSEEFICSFLKKISKYDEIRCEVFNSTDKIVNSINELFKKTPMNVIVVSADPLDVQIKYLTSKYDVGTFACSLDLKNNIAFLNDVEKCSYKIKKDTKMQDYWMSRAFVKYRKNIIKQLATANEVD